MADPTGVHAAKKSKKEKDRGAAEDDNASAAVGSEQAPPAKKSKHRRRAAEGDDEAAPPANKSKHHHHHRIVSPPPTAPAVVTPHTIAEAVAGLLHGADLDTLTLRSVRDGVAAALGAAACAACPDFKAWVKLAVANAQAAAEVEAALGDEAHVDPGADDAADDEGGAGGGAPGYAALERAARAAFPYLPRTYVAPPLATVTHANQLWRVSPAAARDLAARHVAHDTRPWKEAELATLRRNVAALEREHNVDSLFAARDTWDPAVLARALARGLETRSLAGVLFTFAMYVGQQSLLSRCKALYIFLLRSDLTCSHRGGRESLAKEAAADAAAPAADLLKGITSVNQLRTITPVLAQAILAKGKQGPKGVYVFFFFFFGADGCVWRGK